jgi:hypothetical protein
VSKSDNRKYIEALGDALVEYKKLTDRRKEIDERLGKLVRLIAANINMLPDDQQELFLARFNEMTPPTGLSDAILRILSTDEYMSPIEVRDKLLETGSYDFAGQANPLASIHTTLKRLVDSEDVIANTPQPDGKTYYKRVDSKGTGFKYWSSIQGLSNPARGSALHNLSFLAGLKSARDKADK